MRSKSFTLLAKTMKLQKGSSQTRNRDDPPLKIEVASRIGQNISCLNTSFNFKIPFECIGSTICNPETGYPVPPESPVCGTHVCPEFDWLDQDAEANETKCRGWGLARLYSSIGNLPSRASDFCILRLFFFCIHQFQWSFFCVTTSLRHETQSHKQREFGLPAQWQLQFSFVFDSPWATAFAGRLPANTLIVHPVLATRRSRL